MRSRSHFSIKCLDLVIRLTSSITFQLQAIKSRLVLRHELEKLNQDGGDV